MRRRTHAVLTLIGVALFATLSMAQMRISEGIGSIVKVPEGSVSAPSFASKLDPDHGMFFVTSDSRTYLAANGITGLAVSGTPSIEVRSDAIFRWSSNAVVSSAATFDLTLSRGGAGLLNISDADATPDLNFNVNGSPTLSTCGDGAVATGSSNTSGRVNSTDATACTLTFSVSFGGNSADCWIANLTANRGFVSAASSTAMTVSSLTAGDDFMYFCVGR